MRRSRAVLVAFAAALAACTLHAQPAERTGKQVVDSVCISCHGSGTGGAPRIGDQQAWIPRAKLGFNTLVASAIKGHGGMPARGGMANLTDPEISAAITYMLGAGTGKQ